MSKIEVLPTAKRAVEKSLVKLCRELLNKAEKGEIVEVLAIAIAVNGDVLTLANETEHRSRRIGAAAQLLYDLTSSPSR